MLLEGFRDLPTSEVFFSSDFDHRGDLSSGASVTSTDSYIQESTILEESDRGLVFKTRYILYFVLSGSINPKTRFRIGATGPFRVYSDVRMFDYRNQKWVEVKI